MFRIIINPKAGAGRALQVLESIKNVLRERNIQFDIRETAYRMHAKELAITAVAEGISGIIAIGGDGTMFEVANGLDGSSVTLYIVSCGTGNDFIKTLGLPKDPVEALKLQLDSPVKDVDMGKASVFRFLNVAGAGFDVEVLRQTEQFKQRYHGIIPYMLGVIKAIRHYKPFSGELRIDSQAIHGEFTLVVIANGQYYGGGMRVARKADPYDGLFDVIYIPKLPKWKICLLLPFFMSGVYDVFPVAHRVRTNTAELESKEITINMDGELRTMDNVMFENLHNAVHMHLPA